MTFDNHTKNYEKLKLYIREELVSLIQKYKKDCSKKDIIQELKTIYFFIFQEQF